MSALGTLGFPIDETAFTGLMQMDVHPSPTSFSGGGHGTVGSGDINISSAPVPEPATLALFGSGLIGIAGLLRRKLTL